MCFLGPCIVTVNIVQFNICMRLRLEHDVSSGFSLIASQYANIACRLLLDSIKDREG